MHFPTSILFLLSLLPAMPLRDLKAPGRPPIASLSPGRLTPRFTPIATIVFGPWHGPDGLWPVPRDEHDQAFSLSTDALDEESEEEGLEVQEQACLALIEEPDVCSHVLFPGSFPTPHACLSIDPTESPRGPPWIIFSQ
jgi:hypothetical protein